MLNKIKDHTNSGDDFIYGWILNEDGSQTNSTCLITHRNDRFEAIIPFCHQNPEIARWFASGNGLLPSLASVNEIPESIWVKSILDSGIYSLVGSRAIHSSLNWVISSPVDGKGIVLPAYIVKGRAGQDYSLLHKVRTKYDELLYWTQLSSLESSLKLNEKDNRTLEEYKTGFKKQSPISFVYNECCISLVPIGSFSHDKIPTKSIRLFQDVVFETSYSSPFAFDKHMKRHQELRSLISIILWRGVAIDEIKVFRQDDQIRYSDGKVVDNGFRSILTDQYNTWEKDNLQNENFLFYYPSIGTDGLKRWFQLCDEYPNLTGHLYYLAANYSHIPLESIMTEFGILFEEIKKPLDLSREVKSIERIVLKVIESINSYREVMPPRFNAFKSARDIACSYNSIKHTDEQRREKPREYWLDPRNLSDVVIVCRAILQIWTAKMLGCSVDNIAQKPVNNPSVCGAFERIDQMDFSIEDLM